jgi:ATP-dependent DNA helicase RecG
MTEDLNHEFKQIYTKDVIKTIIAFANTLGGKLYIGLNDDGKAVDLENLDEELLKLSNAIRDNVKPDVTQFTKSSFVKVDDKQVIVCEVQKGTSRPYYLSSKGIRPEGVFVRQAASSVPASASAIVKMIKETDGDSYEEERSINQNLNFVTLRAEFQNKGLTLSEPQMRTLGILNENSLYTNLGFLLSDECNHSIKVAVFEGNTKSIFRDRHEFSGSLITQLKDSFSFIDRYNRTSSTISGLERMDFRDYPNDAIREALLNCIIHKDYGYGGSTLISIFDNRIEFITIGGLVKGLTKEDIMIGISLSRNKKLADVFYRLKWVEAYGTGIMKIKEAYENNQEKPDFEVTDNAFKMSLPIFRQVKEKNFITLNESEERILQFLKEEKSIVRSEVEQLLSISQAMAIKLLKSLVNKELIAKVGTGKNIKYVSKEVE